MSELADGRKRIRLNAQRLALRRMRIMAGLRCGWSYDAIARAEEMTIKRVREIVAEALRRREADADRADLNLARIEGGLRRGEASPAAHPLRRFPRA